MAALRKAKDERFVHLVADGKSGVDAYLEAGHMVSRKVAGVSASRLLKRPEVKARLDEIIGSRASIDAQATAKAVERLAISKERVLAEIAKVAFSNAGDYFAWGPSGVTVKDCNELSEDQRAAVAEASETVTEAGGTVRVKMHSKMDALDKLGRYLGLFKEVHEHSGRNGGPIRIEEEPMTDIERARRIVYILREGAIALETETP
jgi:phage terminase small subunit